MNKKITVNLAVAIAIIAMTVTFVVTMILSMQMFNHTVSSVREKEIMYNKLSEMDKSARADYYGEIVDETLYDYIAAGYVTGMGDKEARYYTARQYLDYLNRQNGILMGVGTDVVKDANGYARIIKVYPNSAAEESGLEKDWFITKIGDTDVKSLSLNQINNRLMGESGTTVQLTVVNATAENEHVVEIQRHEFDLPSVEAMVPEGSTTAYFKVNLFNSRTVDEIKAYLERWEEEQTLVEGLIFDVRNNAGVNLSSAMQVIDYLCPVGPIASRLNKDGSVTTLETSDANEVDMPVNVIVNGNTAHAAELFATSIREFGKGRIIGTRTAGRGTIQCRPVALSDGSAFSYTIGILQSRGGTTFNGIGVTPDVEVALTAEQEADFYRLDVYTDPQIRRALDVMDTLTGRNTIDATIQPNPENEQQVQEPDTQEPAEPAQDDAA